MKQESKPYQETGVIYYSPYQWEIAPKGFKIYLYKWKSPSGHVGVSCVYTINYKQFLILLTHWTKNNWEYIEL